MYYVYCISINKTSADKVDTKTYLYTDSNSDFQCLGTQRGIFGGARRQSLLHFANILGIQSFQT